MSKKAFIYNPVSGKGIIKQNLGNIIELLSDEEPLTLIPTGRNIKENIRDFDGDRIICAGGDGTIHNLIEASLQVGYKGVLGYIPVGTTNDFANSIGVPHDILEAAKVAVGDKIISCDEGRFNTSEYFDYVAAFGLFTRVSYATPQDKKNSFGYLAYMMEGAKELPDIKAYDMSIEADGVVTSGRYIYGSISNSRFVGGFKLPYENIRLDDGVFEVILVKEHPRKDLPKVANYLLGLTTSCKYVETFKSSKVKIHADGPVPWTLDGEDGGTHTEVNITNINKAFTIAVQ